MSRAPAVPGIIDIRSAAIFQEYVLMTNPCAPGASRLKRGKFHLDLALIKSGKFFDTTKSWVTLFAAMIVIATVMGIFHATFLLVPIVQFKYKIGIVTIVLVYVLTYMIFIKMTTIACYCIKFIGHRLTVTFGMIIFFLGVILDVFMEEEPDATWYASTIMMGIGASFAYTAAMSIVSDHFRVHLGKALAIVSSATPLGILMFYLMTYFLLTHISYRWTKLILGTVVLVMTGIAQTFGRARRCDVNTSHPIDNDWQDKEHRIRECVKKGAGVEPLAKARTDDCIPGDILEDPNEEKSCLCVCVCDVSLWSDWSFVLWALISTFAVIPYLIPYFFLIAYAFEVGTTTSISLVCWMCVASVAMRMLMMPGEDFTFVSNRITFQVCLVLCGLLYIAILWAETYGWILVWGISMGAVEGLLAVVIPRITLLTIPRLWIVSSWSCILWFHAVGIAIGPLIVVSVWWYWRTYTEAFVTIAILQFVGAILATLLPNEESELFEAEGTTTVESNQLAMVGVGLAGVGNGPPMLSYASRYANTFRFASEGGNYRAGCGPGLAKPRNKSKKKADDKNYQCCCPICRKYGCVPGCTPCTPGGLVEGYKANDTGDDLCGQDKGNTQSTGNKSAKPNPGKKSSFNPSHEGAGKGKSASVDNTELHNCPSVSESRNVLN